MMFANFLYDYFIKWMFTFPGLAFLVIATLLISAYFHIRLLIDTKHPKRDGK